MTQLRRKPKLDIQYFFVNICKQILVNSNCNVLEQMRLRCRKVKVPKNRKKK